MTLLALLAFQTGVHFDWTITLGNLITIVAAGGAAVIAWIDLRWRVRNLETWRMEHMIDADARDILLTNIDKILYHVTRGAEGKASPK